MALRMIGRFRSGQLALLCVITLLLAECQGHAQQPRQVLHNHVRSEVSNGRAALVGPVPATQRIQLSIVLPLRNQDALARLLPRLYDPSSSDFRQFLNVNQFTEQFSPTLADFQSVVDFARANGFSVDGSPANRLIVPISGTAAQIEKAFKVRMNNYQHPTDSRTFFSPDREPSLDLSVPVAHIVGLNNFSVPRPAFKKASRAVAIPAQTGSGPDGFFLPGDMRAAYYGGSDLTGSGQAIGIFELYGGYSINDVTGSFYGTATTSISNGSNYVVAYTPAAGGITYNVPINNVLLDGTSATTASGNDVEQVLDIVQAIGMAPGLTQVRVYIGNNDIDILNSMATENICKELSISWGWEPDDPSTDDPIFQEFAAQGQSVFAASGDSGGYNPGYPAYPAEDAYVTAVGGTDLVTNGAGGSWNSETAWSDSGGGPSPDRITLPSWQTGVANASNEGSTTLRNVPDVAMEANTDSYICAAPYGCIEGIGGTSMAAPLWAAFMALVNQQAQAAGNPNVGFINPAIYSIGANANYSSDFNDISSGNNDCCGLTLSYNAVNGYDLVTGWGSAKGQSLIDALAGPLPGPVMTLAASPNFLTTYPGASGTSTIIVNSLGGFSGSVNLTISGLPNGVTASLSTNPTAVGSLLTITASSTAAPGSYSLTITGTSGAITATTVLALTIDPPGFSLLASSGMMQISPGSPSTNTVTVTALGDFTGNVSLSASGLPGGVTASFSPNPTTGSSLMTLTASIFATTGTSTVTVTGTSGSVNASTSVVLVTNPAMTIPPEGYAPSSVTFGPVNIGTTSTTIPLGFTFVADATIGSTSVLTGGAPSLDFANAGSGTCTANTQFMAGGTCVVNVSFTPKFAGVRDGAVVLADSSGNVIATGYIQGLGLGPQVNFLPNVESAVLSSGLDSPYGVAVDGSGNVYVVDTGNARILKETLSVNGYIQSTLPTSTLSSPLAIAVDGSGNVYIADVGTNRILKETPTTGSYSESVVSSNLGAPEALAVDGNGNIYIAIFPSFDASNNLVPGVLYEESPSSGSYSQTVIPTPGVLSLGGIAVDGNGNIYISESDNGISPPPAVVNDRVLKETLSSGAYTQSVIPTSGLGTPWGIAVDAGGNVYISDTTNNTILKETLSAGNYVQSEVLTSQLDLPVGIAVEGSGNVYIADTFDQRILKEDFADTPNLVFASTAYGLISSDSPQTVSLENIGNLALTFPVPSTGSNPSISNNFALNSLATAACPVVSSSSLVVGTLAAGATCQLPVSFTPETEGTIAGSLVLTDNSLSGPSAYSTQSIPLSGTSFKATPTIAWATPAAISLGTPLSLSQLDATSTIAGNFSYMPKAGTILAAGSHTLSVTFTPTDTKDYSTSTATVVLVVNQATPKITWPSPAAIWYGTALSGKQLNASAAIAGTFTYSPASGTVLSAGSQTLSVTFTPRDTTDYATTVTTVTLVVQPGVLTLSAKNASRTYGTANPAFQFSITGFVNGDTAATAVTGAPGLSTTATPGSSVGVYPIAAAAGTLAAANYTFAFMPGALTVSKAALIVAATNESVIYNQPLPKLTYTVSGFINGDSSTVLSGAPVETTPAKKGSAVGTYQITIIQGTLSAENYSFEMQNGTLTITPLGTTATPVFSPQAGSYTSEQKVTLSDSTSGATIYYTTNGTAPTTASSQYKNAIPVSSTETINAMAVAPGYLNSSIATAKYTIK